MQRPLVGRESKYRSMDEASSGPSSSPSSSRPVCGEGQNLSKRERLRKIFRLGGFSLPQDRLRGLIQDGAGSDIRWRRRDVLETIPPGFRKASFAPP